METGLQPHPCQFSLANRGALQATVGAQLGKAVVWSVKSERAATQVTPLYIKNSTITFSLSQFPFVRLATEAVAAVVARIHPGKSLTDLSRLHEVVSGDDIPQVYEALYSLFLTEEFQLCYGALCLKIINDYLNGKASYQKIPSARIQTPGNRSVNFHTDEWYGHGKNIRNFWLPLVSVRDEGSMYVADDDVSQELIKAIKREKLSVAQTNELCAPRCNSLNLDPGMVYRFHARTIHGTVVSSAETSRVSFDFRMVCDGDDRGLKDESFFISPGRRVSTEKASGKRIGVVYIGRPFDKILSQKYQTLITYRYAAEQEITVLVGETELSGFDYEPTLWNLIEGTWCNQFQDLIFYSAQLLPSVFEDRMRLFSESNKRKITIHFVAEDVIWSPGQNAQFIENLLRSHVSKLTPPQS